MNIQDINQYPHKITKINVNNSNDTKSSDYQTVILKVTLNENDDETIVFTDSANNIIPTQKNDNDYYLSITNQAGISIIYAHHLITDLYEYDDFNFSDDIFMSYDLKNLSKHSIRQDYHITNDEKPKVASLIKTPNNTSEYEEKDPNYKHYSKGHFPISSRYNIDGNKKLIAPKINQNSNAQWDFDAYIQDTNMPQWEVHIPREELKIVPKDIDEVNPINVYLNYQYLPTSTEYHQHFFGFEDKVQTSCKNINVLDGDNLNIVNKDFGEDGTFRLINIHSKTDTSQKFFTQHNIQSDIKEFNSPIIHNESCNFEKDMCDGYYTYIPLLNHENYGLHIDLTLKKNVSYILKYYVWIPNTISVNDDISVEIYSEKTTDNTTGFIAGLPQIFKDQDKVLTQQWVYHEIPFTTQHSHNQIHIKGPRYEEGIDKEVFFINFVLEEIVPYSPTIKYTNKGVFVTEQNSDSIVKQNKDHKNLSNTSDNDNVECINPKNNGIEIEDKKLPTPYKKIYIDFDDNFDINYSQRTGLFTYTPVDCNISYNNIIGEYENLFITEMNVNQNGDIELTLESKELINQKDIINFVTLNEEGDLEYEHKDTEANTDSNTNNNDEPVNAEENTSFTNLNYDEPIGIDNVEVNANSELIFTLYKIDEAKDPNEGTLCYESDMYTSEVDNNEYECVTFDYIENDIEDDENNILYKSGDLVVNYRIKQLFTRGMNNKFQLKFYSEDEAKMNKGYVNCCITETNTEDSVCIKKLGKKYISNNGTVTYNQLNFSNLKDDEYYLRIEYVHPCYKEHIVEYRKIWLIPEVCVMTLYALKGDNEREIINDNEITIESENDFPLRIDAAITNTLGSIINEGYCELSIDDEVKYTTLVDEYGIADFYLNYNVDNLKNNQNIKIIYYRKKDEANNNEGGYFNALTSNYFNINIPNALNYKDRVPIRTKVLINNRVQQDNNIIEINKDDCLVIDLDTSDEHYINYSIRIYKGEELIKINNDDKYINIISHSNDSTVVFDFFDDNEDINQDTTIEYTIVTDNKITSIMTNNDKETINYGNNNKYREYRQKFTVVWKNREAT